MEKTKQNSFTMKKFFPLGLFCLLLCTSVSIKGLRVEEQIKSQIVNRLKGLNEDNRSTILFELVQHVQLKDVTITQGILDALSNNTQLKKELVLATLTDLAKTEASEFDDKVKGLQLLFHLQPDLWEIRLDDQQGTPLLHAAELAFTNNGRQLEFIQMLIDNNANLNIRDHHNSTVLHWAVRSNAHIYEIRSLIKILIKNGVDPNAVNQWGQTFLHYACCKTSVHIFHEIVSYLDSIGNTKSFTIRDHEGAEVLHLAVVCYKHLGNDTLQIFKSNGVDFSARQDNNLNVMDCAVSVSQNVAFFRTLIAFGAEYGRKNDSLETSLHWAAYNGNLPAIELFMSLGISVNTEDKEGSTPLYYAVQGQQEYDFIVRLIRAGADRKILNKETRASLLHVAAQSGNLVAVNFFISFGGTDVNAKDSHGDTPLHYVFHPNSKIGENTFDIVNQFSRRGANLNAQNELGEKPVDLARKRIVDRKFRRRIVRLLVRRMSPCYRRYGRPQLDPVCVNNLSKF